jgi:hypothetical protein
MAEIADLPPTFTTAAARASGLHPRGGFAELRRQIYAPTATGSAAPAYSFPLTLSPLVSAVASIRRPLAANTGERRWQPDVRRWNRLPD